MAEYIRIDRDNSYAGGKGQYVMKSEIEHFMAQDNFGGQYHQNVVVFTKSGKRIQTELYISEFLKRIEE